jgi:tetratricopeptide (TPR) repeat protein
MSNKQDLKILFEYFRDQMTAVPNFLETQTLEEVGQEDDWSAKDNLFHALVWASNRLEMLETLTSGKTWNEIDHGDYKDINREIFYEYRDKSWEDLGKMITTTYKRGMSYLDAINDAELGRKMENDDRAFWLILAHNFLTHPMIHIWEILQKANQIDKLIEIFGKEYTDMLRKLDRSDNWQGLVDYNYACLLSLSGQQTKALASLKNALELNPQLIEWSKEDPDLESVRDLEDYRSLYKD